MACGAETVKELRAELECPVCQEWYCDPVDLSCGHNFCRECVISAFHAARNNPEKVTPKEHVDCPVCRKRLFTSEEKIKNMPMNLKLRNIISAIQDKSKEMSTAKPPRCQMHNKPHQLYCHHCKEVKCITCFMKVCSKSRHNTEELDDVAAELRTMMAKKKSAVERDLRAINKTAAADSERDVETLVEDLPQLLEQLTSLKRDLVDHHTMVSLWIQLVSVS